MPSGTPHQSEPPDSDSGETEYEVDHEEHEESEEDYFFLQEDGEIPTHLPDQQDPQERNSSSEVLPTGRPLLRHFTRTRRPPDQFGVYIQH